VERKTEENYLKTVKKALKMQRTIRRKQQQQRINRKIFSWIERIIYRWSIVIEVFDLDFGLIGFIVQVGETRDVLRLLFNCWWGTSKPPEGANVNQIFLICIPLLSIPNLKFICLKLFEIWLIFSPILGCWPDVPPKISSNIFHSN